MAVSAEIGPGVERGIARREQHAGVDVHGDAQRTFGDAHLAFLDQRRQRLVDLLGHVAQLLLLDALVLVTLRHRPWAGEWGSPIGVGAFGLTATMAPELATGNIAERR